LVRNFFNVYEAFGNRLFYACLRVQIIDVHPFILSIRLPAINECVYCVPVLCLFTHSTSRQEFCYFSPFFTYLRIPSYGCFYCPDFTQSRPFINTTEVALRLNLTEFALRIKKLQNFVHTLFIYIQYNTIQYNAIRYYTIQYSTCTVQYNTMQCNTIQYNLIQYNAIACFEYFVMSEFNRTRQRFSSTDFYRC